MADTVPNFYQAATAWHTRCTECDGRGCFRSGLGPRRTCQTCHGEGTVPVPSFPFYPPIPTRKPKTMSDSYLASTLPRRPLVECPCCHGRGQLFIVAPCGHCEETGRVQAEVGASYDPRSLVHKSTEVFGQIAAASWVAAFSKRHPPRSSKAPKRSHDRTRKLVNSGKPTRKPRG